MQDILVILISSILINNLVLTEFFGLSSLFGSPQKIEPVIGLSLATILLITLATIANFAVDRLILQPFGLEYLRTLAFVVTIGAVIPAAKKIGRMTSPVIKNSLALFMPLIFSNTAVLGISLTIINENISFIESMFAAISTGIGFSLILIMFTLLRERAALADVPRPFQGAAIGFVTAGLMSLGFMGLIGI